MNHNEIACLDRFEESERLFLDVDRRDLAVSMRKKLGDWFRVLQLLKGSAGGLGNDKETEEAWNNIGRHHAERHEWSEAVTYYEKARNTERLIQVCPLTPHIFLGLFTILRPSPTTPYCFSDNGKAEK